MSETSGAGANGRRIEPKYVSLLWASVERAGELADMHGQIFEKGWDEQTFAKMLSDPITTALVAQIGPPQVPLVTVGFVAAHFVADEAEILTLGVVPNAQRRGIGRMLVGALSRAAINAQIKHLYLEVAKSNGAAISLYRSLDFEELGERKGYYPNRNAPPEDAMMMALAL